MDSCSLSCNESRCQSEPPHGASHSPTKTRCMRCGEEEQGVVGCAGACAGCTRSWLEGKCRTAVSGNWMIGPMDRVLVGYSGGPGSRVVLQFIHEMQSKALQSWAASKAQSLPVFSVGVAFINEFNFNSEIHAIDGAIGSNSAKNHSIDGAIGPNSAKNHSIDGAIGSNSFNSSAIGSIDGAIGAIDDAIGEIDGAIGEIDDAIGEIDGAIGEIDGAIGEIDGAIGEIDGAIGAIGSNSSAIPSINGSINSNSAINGAIEEMRALVADLSPPQKEFHVFAIEDLCENGGNELRELVSEIKDETGKEDFLRYLRMIALQKIAVENGYTKLVLGSCASSIARHVISSTVKGQGYSLPADIQYVDTRYKVPVVLPIRDLLEQELIALCDIDKLKTQEIFEKPRAGINGLVSSFVTHLREENPSREHTILRTAGKLKPFKFNKFTSQNYDFVPSRLRPKFQNLELDISDDSDEFCLICFSPLTETEVKKKEGLGFRVLESCCETCRFQILPKGEKERDGFFRVLPEPFLKRSLLREEIKDYLLDGDIDEI